MCFDIIAAICNMNIIFMHLIHTSHCNQSAKCSSILNEYLSLQALQRMTLLHNCMDVILINKPKRMFIIMYNLICHVTSAIGITLCVQ